MKKTVLLALFGTVIGSTACATKGYVNEGLAEVNAKVETLSESLEETQEQTRVNADGVASAQADADAAAASRPDALRKTPGVRLPPPVTGQMRSGVTPSG